MDRLNKEIFEILGLEKIVKTREVFCSCESTKVQKLYKDIDLVNKKAYNTKECKVVDINEYTELDIEYCKACERVDYISAERGYSDSFRMYYDGNMYYNDDTKCPCGGSICTDEGYAIVMKATLDGNIVVKSNCCNRDVVINTGQIFKSAENVIKWLNEVAVVKVNEEEVKFNKHQSDIYNNILNFAKENNIETYTVDDLQDNKRI